MSQNQSFKKLKAEWYKKLAKSGFEDIELGEDKLKRYHSLDFQSNYHPTTFVGRERYFQLAAQLLHDHKFKDQKERAIWQRHVDGWTVRDIARKYGYKSHDTVQITITRLAKFIRV